ncbi:glutamine-hydrolyzing GMP synthase [Kyrpidia spormannii]|uniref:GMP synthetase n=1 Tax=Kyrpidia spormannii TaxID=2055160 RepID=A0ACA8Z4T2_9BACL|nr:glutamine-hydrolyzing GMP synthase [Kyrpidia spormannii]CAB3389462.1 GMP synthetase [Kyrpidia spormannii]
MQPHEWIAVLDFGGQYNQLIARRVRELKVYSELLPPDVNLDELRRRRPRGIIFSGGPNSVYAPGAPTVDPRIYEWGIPVLGICYGMQLMAAHFSAAVDRAAAGEYGKALLERVPGSGSVSPGIAGRGADTAGIQPDLLDGLPARQTVWMSHGDVVTAPPEGFVVEGRTDRCPVAVMHHLEKPLYAVQFHPEVQHTEFGQDILRRFVYDICGCTGGWTMSSYAREAVEEIRRQVGDGQVLCALSGGVDSAVAAVLVHRAVGDRLTCVFVDHGLLRKGEADRVMEAFARGFGMKIVRVDAGRRFLARLGGVRDPEQKRKIIGEEFIRVFEEEADRLGKFDFLAQGTLYTDIIESGTKTAATIKSHHNVGGLPERMSFRLIEPLNTLFKDEVRALGTELGIPEDIVWRQPFPGPGLAIRILGEVTQERLSILREADAVVREEIRKAGLHREIWQYFAVLPDVRSVGVMGDERTYAYTIAIRAVTSRDGMTADFARIPYEVLERLSGRIVAEVPQVNRVVYDITSKPPATIEWE